MTEEEILWEMAEAIDAEGGVYAYLEWQGTDGDHVPESIREQWKAAVLAFERFEEAAGELADVLPDVEGDEPPGGDGQEPGSPYHSVRDGEPPF
ncbi:hypothetical protein [Streptomyces hydrogenans]|uniref:hypothetical protein n=1 Tax=Streptomyces hydrogenans TaxID=1873719 RepID=UPI0035DE058E